MEQRATLERMHLRRSTVEHPFASLKHRIFVFCRVAWPVRWPASSGTDCPCPDPSGYQYKVKLNVHSVYFYNARMAMSTRKQREEHEDFWFADSELASAPGHPFYIG